MSVPVELIDSHCHLDDKQFQADRETIINRALQAGVTRMLTIGTGDGPADLGCAIRLAEAYSFVYATVGVHPNDSEKVQESTFPHLDQLARHPKVVAIGEIGLDYHWGVPADLQKTIFRQQLELAAEHRLPVIIHTREAWTDTFEMLEAHWAPTHLPCLLHCFTGGPAEARRADSLGCYFGLGGVLTYPKSTELRDVAAGLPKDRLLLETDAPYLPPVPFRGKRNEPSYVTYTAETLASVRNVSLDEVARQTTLNFQNLFLRRDLLRSPAEANPSSTEEPLRPC